MENNYSTLSPSNSRTISKLVKPIKLSELKLSANAKRNFKTPLVQINSSYLTSIRKRDSLKTNEEN